MNENLRKLYISTEIQTIFQWRNETGIVLELKFKEKPANIFVQCSYKLPVFSRLKLALFVYVASPFSVTSLVK